MSGRKICRSSWGSRWRVFYTKTLKPVYLQNQMWCRRFILTVSVLMISIMHVTMLRECPASLRPALRQSSWNSRNRFEDMTFYPKSVILQASKPKTVPRRVLFETFACRIHFYAAVEFEESSQESFNTPQRKVWLLDTLDKLKLLSNSSTSTWVIAGVSVTDL